MRSPLIITIALSGFLAGAVMSPQSAQAFTDGPMIVAAITALQQATSKFISNLGTQITSSVTNMGTKLFDQLGSGFTQLTNYTKAAVGAQEQIADASNVANAQFQRSLRNVQVRDEHTINPQDCQNLGGGQAAVVAVRQGREVAAALDKVKDARNQAAKGTPSWVGEAQAAQAANQLHFSRYCSDAEQEAGLCPGVSAALKGADLSVSSLVGKASYAGQPDIDAANDYVTALTQPVAPAALRGSAITSTAGQQQLPMRRAYAARISLAQDIAHWVLGMHAATVPLTDAQQKEMVAEGLTLTTTGSAYQALDLEVSRHYSGATWQGALQAMDSKSVLVQIALLQAQANYIALQAFQLQQKQALAQSAELATVAEKDFKFSPTMPAPFVTP